MLASPLANPSHRSPSRASIALLLLCLLILLPATSVHAVSAQGRVSVTLGNADTLATTAYTIGNFRTGNGETVTGYTVSFPAGPDVSGATSAGTGDIVSYPAANAVRVELGTTIPQRTTFQIALGNVINPSTAGEYQLVQIVFHRNAGNETFTMGARDGLFTITAAPFLLLTIETPDGSSAVDFGDVYPGIPTDSIEITLTVQSSDSYTITRTLGGDAAALGLIATGVPEDLRSAGTTVYVDSLTLEPPWETTPEIPYTATVDYAVVQQ